MADEIVSFDDIVSSDPSKQEGFESRKFSEGYRQECFIIWYNNGKPNCRQLQKLIPPYPYNNKKPSHMALETWIERLYQPQAKVLDDEVVKRFNERLVEEKIEMLQRHAETGKNIQEIAYNYIKDHQDELTINSAVRMWVAGIETERASRGIPDALRKMNEMTDADLMKQIETIIKDSPGELLPNIEKDEDIGDVHIEDVESEDGDVVF